MHGAHIRRVERRVAGSGSLPISFLGWSPPIFPLPPVRDKLGRAAAQQFHDGASHPVDQGLNQQFQ
jgi:hypothetical protein